MSTHIMGYVGVLYNCTTLFFQRRTLNLLKNINVFGNIFSHDLKTVQNIILIKKWVNLIV